MTYPVSHVPSGGGVYNPVAGVQAVYGRNALSPINSLTLGGQSVVTSAYYDNHDSPAGPDRSSHLPIPPRPSKK